MALHGIVPLIRGRDIACSEWANVWGLEKFFELLDFVNDALDVHA